MGNDYTVAPLQKIKEKKNDEKASDIKDDILALMKNNNESDAWPFILLAILPMLCGGSSSADYWRGKYDAYKEIFKNDECNKNNDKGEM